MWLSEAALAVVAALCVAFVVRTRNSAPGTAAATTLRERHRDLFYFETGRLVVKPHTLANLELFNAGRMTQSCSTIMTSRRISRNR